MSNTFRKQYRELTAAEQEHVEQIKDAAERLEQLILDTPRVCTRVTAPPEMARHVALAITNLEQVVFWATKAAT